VRFALIGGKLANEGEDEGNVVRLSRADVSHEGKYFLSRL
jgi:hypothetical protein